jgi:hypothetical protein
MGIQVALLEVLLVVQLVVQLVAQLVVQLESLQVGILEV